MAKIRLYREEIWRDSYAVELTEETWEILKKRRGFPDFSFDDIVQIFTGRMNSPTFHGEKLEKLIKREMVDMIYDMSGPTSERFLKGEDFYSIETGDN